MKKHATCVYRLVQSHLVFMMVMKALYINRRNAIKKLKYHIACEANGNGYMGKTKLVAVLNVYCEYVKKKCNEE